MTKKKLFSAKEKSSILMQHYKKKVAISELCTANQCSPGAIYQWQETLFARAHIIFEQSTKKIGRPANEVKAEKKVKALEEKLAAKNEVISELMEELLKEKKLNGVI